MATFGKLTFGNNSIRAGDVGWGEHIDIAAQSACDLSRAAGKPVHFEFNDRTVTADALRGDTVETVKGKYERTRRDADVPEPDLEPGGDR